MKKALLYFLLCTPAVYAQGNYTFDKNHSRLTFSIMHLGVSHVEGTFKVFEVAFQSKKADFTDGQVELAADVNSLNTDVEMRDKDLKSEDWFNAEKYPKILFKSTAFKKIDNTNYKLEGNITMHGVTKPIVLDVVYNGKVQNPQSKKSVLGFTVSGKLNRKDFDIGSGNAVGNEVDIRSNIEFITD
jgi:polyisoprenoid-binding protein YceI